MKKLLFGCLAVVGFVVIALVAIVVIVAVRSPSQTVTTATPKPAPPKAEEKAGTPARIGERVESAGIALTVNSVNRADTLGQIMRAKPGRIFIVVDVSLESSARDKAPYNPLYFKVKDGNGYEYNGSSIGADNSLKSGELNQGEKVRGTVAFDVPTEAKGLVLSYQPLVIFGGYQTIRVALE